MPHDLHRQCLDAAVAAAEGRQRLQLEYHPRQSAPNTRAGRPQDTTGPIWLLQALLAINAQPNLRPTRPLVQVQRATIRLTCETSRRYFSVQLNVLVETFERNVRF